MWCIEDILKNSSSTSHAILTPLPSPAGHPSTLGNVQQHLLPGSTPKRPDPYLRSTVRSLPHPYRVQPLSLEELDQPVFSPMSRHVPYGEFPENGDNYPVMEQHGYSSPACFGVTTPVSSGNQDNAGNFHHY